MKELTGDKDILLLKIRKPDKTGVYVGYDWWGFVAYCDDPLSMLVDIDQSPLKFTITTIKNWYNL